MPTRAHERMIWLLTRMTSAVRCPFGMEVAWDADLVDAFLEAFPEALKTTRFYTMGPHSVPMLNAAAQRAKRLGYVTPGVVGNQDARQYNQRTWCRCWTITPAGRAVTGEQKRKAP